MVGKCEMGRTWATGGRMRFLSGCPGVLVGARGDAFFGSTEKGPVGS